VMQLQVSFCPATGDHDIACWLSNNCCYTMHWSPERCTADAGSMLVP
jgi:hypothetical protein